MFIVYAFDPLYTQDVGYRLGHIRRELEICEESSEEGSDMYWKWIGIWTVSLYIRVYTAVG